MKYWVRSPSLQRHACSWSLEGLSVLSCPRPVYPKKKFISFFTHYSPSVILVLLFTFLSLLSYLQKVISHSAESSEHRSLPTKWGLSILLCLKGLLYHHKSEEPVSFIQKQLQQRTVVSWLTDLITQKIWRKKKKAVLASKAFPETPETGKLQDLVYETSRAEWRKYWRNAAQVKDHRIIES